MSGAATAAASPGRPIVILHVIPTLGVGGTERQLVGLLTRMDGSRFRQTVCFYTRSVTFEAELQAAGIRTVFHDKFTMPPWVFLARLRRVVREVRPDIVHTWLFSGNFWGRIAAYSCGVRTIVSSDRSLPPRASAGVVLYERFFAPRTVRLANSRAAAESLGDRYGLDVSRIRVIENAVDPAPARSEPARRQARAELGLPPDAPVVLMVARQTVEKNHPMFFRAARRVAQARPGTTFVALGHLFDPPAMRRAVEAAGAADAVRIVEQREDVGRWLSAADVFCLTSNEEGLPNVVLEAMAAGLPVVCADFASARDIVGGEGLGVIVPRDDDAALAEAVVSLLGDEGRRRRLGDAGRALVRDRFPWERLVRDMTALYTGLAGRG